MARKKQEQKETREIMFRNPDLTEADTLGLSNQLGDRIFAPNSAMSEWSRLQHTLFIIALGRIKNWTINGNKNTVVLNNENVMKELGWDLNPKNLRKMGDVLRNEFTYMVSHSTIRLQNPATRKWIAENFIIGAEGDSRFTRVTINPKFMPHCEDLYFAASNYRQSFYTVLEPDIASFKHKGSYPFYCAIRRHKQCKTKNNIVETTLSFGVDELRDALGLTESEYTRSYDNKNNQFVTNFALLEKRVLTPVINEINSTELIKILPWNDNKLFRKSKEKNKVSEYLFKVRVLDISIVKQERQRLLDVAKRAGLSPKFYPDLTTTKTAMLSDWKGNWVIDKIITAEESESLTDENVDNNKRNDKLAQDALNLFGLTSNDFNDENIELRPITTEQYLNIQKTKNEK